MLAGSNCGGEPRQVWRHALDPQRVGIHVEKRLVAEQLQRLHDAAAGIEQLAALVGDLDLRPRAAFQMILDLVRHVVHVDDGGFDARVGKAIEHVIDQRLAGDLDQRLRQRVGQRAHARPEPGGEHHARVGSLGSSHCGGSGTCASYQAFRSVIAGWISARRR